LADIEFLEEKMDSRKVVQFVRKVWKDWWKTAFFILFVVIPV
jgi:hypothetical protein